MQRHISLNMKEPVQMSMEVGTYQHVMGIGAI